VSSFTFSSSSLNNLVSVGLAILWELNWQSF